MDKHWSWVVPLLVMGCAPPAAPPGTAPQREAAAGPAPATVELLLNWFPEAEHGGYYAALVHGEYARAGLAVTIKPGGPSVPVIAQVASRRVAFGIANAENVLLGWAEQARTVAVMAPLQCCPRSIMVHAQSGIRRFADLQHVTLAMNSGAPFSLYLQKKLPLSGVQIVPYTGHVAQFLLRTDFAQQAYVFSEPFVARRQGADPYNLMLSDLGFNPYASVLITHPDTVRDEPDLVRRMVAASVRGWRRYLQDPAETNRYLHGLNSEMDLEILAFGAEQLKDLCVTDDVPAAKIGWMTRERWRTLARQLEEVEALAPGTAAPDDVFAPQFVADGATPAPRAEPRDG